MLPDESINVAIIKNIKFSHLEMKYSYVYDSVESSASLLSFEFFLRESLLLKR